MVFEDWSDPLSDENILCCKTSITAEEQRLVDYYTEVKSLLNTYTTKGNTYLTAGKWKESEQYYNIVNDLNNLFYYLEAIQFRMDEDVEMGVDAEIEDYVEDFNLECIAEYFKCKRIDIEPLLEIYNLGLSTTYTTGIGSMEIGVDFEVS